MIKREVFNEILTIVAEETEIEGELIASSSKREDIVDARYILVKILSSRGYYASMIAPLIHHKKRSINYMLSDFENRLSVSPMMYATYYRICSRIAGNNSALTRQ